ncbi:hypothetical protein BAUCODRAFT_39506 [Baudoinia panamericana UAMH 10762]|uniref:RING-type domain-containing protein n=1 Tax=Baudoinia panamericana (strain UAMH 10762) TaxID=717646 RepID=M2LBS7_BAUPA|nr:uncharacterized protein BAUCODRAFT_39506 [Baudoinia panamericana UAMH 10762]EMC91337.1 hypothetical protein BAUCODRAFT_39506 [Baudoinia panamericana UAMH 10762]
MAPMNEYAAVTVYSSQVKSDGEESVLVETGSFTPTRWFLEHGAQHSKGAGGERPTKKRKLNYVDGDVSESDPAYQTASGDGIVIHRVAIDLHFPDTLNSTDTTDFADSDFDTTHAIRVVAREIKGDGDGCQLRITLPYLRSPVLLISCTDIPNPIRASLLRYNPSPRHLEAWYSEAKSKNHPATVSVCSLKRSIGAAGTIVRLEATTSWKSGVSAFPQGMPVGKARVYEDYAWLLHTYPDQARDETESGRSTDWSPSDFYDSVHVPAKDPVLQGLYDGVLDSELYPFQKRAVTWMLNREGVAFKDGRVSPLPLPSQGQLSANFYQSVTDVHGNSCYVSHLEGIMTRTPPVDECCVSGGLLAEEMGLGKTVELLALVSLHKRFGMPSEGVMDGFSGTVVAPSQATLIITPPSILPQWRSELNRHAPALRVFEYEGLSSSRKKSKLEQQLIEDMATKYDVVIATYNTLRSEIHFAEDPPERNMRRTPKFERKRSPLVQIQWWRICLDEAQMVESGVTAAARVARRLPRIHSWAVTGTPLRKNVEDLHGLLIFLRLKPLSDSAKLWSHLVTNHRHLFRRIWSEFALRHTKAYIRDELHLPPQKRVVLTVPFSTVEQQHYSTLFGQMCEDVGLHADGSPVSGDWDPHDAATMEAMRAWLVRLRQTCLHPQVGGRNRKALGRGQGPLRTVAEVLEVMIEQNETAARTEERLLLASQLLRAHIVGNNGDDEHRSEKAVEIYTNATTSSTAVVQEARDRLTAAKAAMAAKGEVTSDSEGEDSASEGLPLLGRLRNNLRTALQLQHACTFFAATSYFQIKSNEHLTAPESDDFKRLEQQETDLYDAAKQVRREVLKESSRKAEATMRQINDMGLKRTLTLLPHIEDLRVGGIEGRKLVEKADELFDLIRDQGQVLVQWRKKMAEYLLKPLVDEDEEGVETTGEEYEMSTKQQDELYVYFDAFKAMHSDLNTFITGESAPLIDHEVKELIKAAKSFLDPDIETGDAVVHAPDLLLQLLEVRNKFRVYKDKIGSVRGLIQEARTMEGSLYLGSGRGVTERTLVQRHLAQLQSIFKDWTKVLAGLEKELELFRKAQNQRLEFYRQLQELSDAVAPYKEVLDPTLDLHALEAAATREEKQSRTLAQLKTKNRFLLHLRDENGAQAERKICVICQQTFENGVLTVCGHQYCKECIQYWWNQHRTCPVCKRKLTLNDFHNITYKPQELKAQEEVQAGTSSPGSATSISQSPLQSSIYSDVDSTLMDEIKSIDIPASYGTKIDTLGRHLHWIREHDPGAKSVVFSQFREFLDVLGTALSEFKIGYSRLGRNGAVEKFKHDPSIDCLLLDAKTDSSGLTLVNATHVFICEPLIQTAVELQAIARVHRIGQTRPTTVWMYLVNDTVEESIYEISVTRRLAHVQSQHQHGKSRSATPAPLQETAIDAANSEQLQSAPLSKLLVAGKGGGELVGDDDIWRCLFSGNAQKLLSKPSVEVEQAVGRHLRAAAAEQREAEGAA